MGYNPIAASTFVISQYASFLARSFKFSSVKAYLGVISLLHKECSLPNPLSDNWAVKSLLTGIKRVKGTLLNRSYLLPLASFQGSISLSTLRTVMMLPFGPFV